jgi:hypothetical protein
VVALGERKRGCLVGVGDECTLRGRSKEWSVLYVITMKNGAYTQNFTVNCL